MSNDRGSQFVRWASLAFVTGGLLMAVLWIIYTNVHGPTSYDQTGVVLGRSTLFWGRLLGGLPNLLVALGLSILYPRLARNTNRRALVGYVLAWIGLSLPAIIDLFVWQSLGPPFFVPVVGAGLILLALGRWHDQHLQPRIQYLLMFIGFSQVIAFAVAIIPLAVFDQIGGYRIYGIFAHFLSGSGWFMLGVSAWKAQPSAVIE